MKQTSKQNITRDIKIKNRLTVMRVEGGGNNRGGVKSRKCIKDPRTKIQKLRTG